MSVRLLRAADRTPRAWLNGGGATTEIACEPAGADFDTFGWRVSIAEVASAGPFSCFAGVDRILSVLDGTLALSLHGATPVQLTSADTAFAFAGDATCHGEPIDGLARDLNVMVRRGQWRASIERHTVSGHLRIDSDAVDTTIIVVSTGKADVAIGADAPQPLGRFDALLIDGDAAGHPLSIASLGGVVHVIRLRR